MNVPPGMVQNPLTDIMRTYKTDDNSDNTDSAAELEDYIGNDTCAWECRIALGETVAKSAVPTPTGTT